MSKPTLREQLEALSADEREALEALVPAEVLDPPSTIQDPRPPAANGRSVGAAARGGDREALRRLGAQGGKRSQELARARKAAEAASVALGTVSERRAELSKAVAKLQVADIDESRKVTALSAAIKLLNDMDGFDELAREVERLRTALTNAQAIVAVNDWQCTAPAPLQVAAPVPAPDAPKRN